MTAPQKIHAYEYGIMFLLGCYNPPEGMEDKCDALPAFRGEGQVISCWHLTLWERIKLLLTGRLWFSVIGNGQPPIWLGVDCPFIRK